MKIGLTYDLRSEYLAAGYGEEETAEFDRDDTIEALEKTLAGLGHQPDRIGHARSLIQRLAACRAPDNLLSRFLSWCLKDIGRDEKVWYVAAYADSGTYNPRTGRPNSGAVYRASGGLYAGQTRGGVEGYLYVTRSIVCQVLTHYASNFSLTNYASNLLKLSRRHFQAKRRLLTYIYTEIEHSEAR